MRAPHAGLWEGWSHGLWPPDQAATALTLAVQPSLCPGVSDKAPRHQLCSYLSSAASAASAFSSSSFFRRPSFSSLPYKSKIFSSNTWVTLLWASYLLSAACSCPLEDTDGQEWGARPAPPGAPEPLLAAAVTWPAA